MKVREKVCKMQGKDKGKTGETQRKCKRKAEEKTDEMQKELRRKAEERKRKGKGKAEKTQNLESRTILQLLFATKNNLCYLTIHILLSSLFK